MTRLIIDTDPGVDDAFAITLAALNPQVDLLAVTSTYGNVGLEATTINARRILALCGRHDVPVAAGAARPWVYPHPTEADYVHGGDGLSGKSHTLPEPQRPLEEEGAVELMARLIRESPEPVTITPIGPLTNVATLLAAYPELAPKIEKIVLMGGGIAKGNATATAEFNIWADPEAAQRVIGYESTRVPVVIVPLDVTHKCAVNAEWLDKLAASGPIGARLVDITSDYQIHYKKSGVDGIVLHDATAVAEAINPGLLTIEQFAVTVDTTFGPSRGTTLVDRRRDAISRATHKVSVATDADVAAVGDYVLAGLS
jgi:pyrimidine-specific ribonucleoside hydrolase